MFQSLSRRMCVASDFLVFWAVGLAKSGIGNSTKNQISAIFLHVFFVHVFLFSLGSN